MGLSGSTLLHAGIQGPRLLLSVALPLPGDLQSCIGASESSQQLREEKMESCAEGFYVPGLKEKHVTAAHVPLARTHTVLLNRKGVWEMCLSQVPG